MAAHESVLLEEAVEWLAPRPNGVIVDGTLGGGGHARRILEKSAPDGRLVGFDRDPGAIREARRVLAGFGERVMVIHDNFKNVRNRIAEFGIGRVQGMLLDLGLSSLQLDEPGRGFSFKTDGPLDMRMDPSEGPSAADIVNGYREEELRELLWKWGEERFARKIVGRIVETRRKKKIRSTFELAALVISSVPASYRYGRIHPATRTFQALRIAVNEELRSLEEFLSSVTDGLDEGARLVIISFHSLEDRIVKNAFRNFQKAGEGKILTKKPVTPSEAEMSRNPRSRSAKLRAFLKIAEEHS
ncbi:MAG: 16S rRNA (cytosine(1402)-N(4))-methyltransferase RsmH [Candidatus Omnitrophica bacterium]|nr:16S rRNA (cytosine(1402)-N(4))-methyltransferase RsmH [Candidatus Omnitrophota bacterium]